MREWVTHPLHHWSLTCREDGLMRFDEGLSLDDETAPEKRLRLAKEYLAHIGRDGALAQCDVCPNHAPL